MKVARYILLILFFIGCSNPDKNENNPEINQFISELDGKSLNEIKEEVNNNIKQFEVFMNFFEGSFSNEIEVIAKEDEQYDEEFKIDTSGIDKALQQLKSLNFVQSFSDYKSKLEFEISNSSFGKPSRLSEGIDQKFIPNKIYYHDGEVKSDSLKDYEVSFSFEQNWGTAKPIDSIDITHKINYTKEYDIITLSSSNSKTNYNGGEIELVKKEGNYIYLTLSDTIPEPIIIEGFNAEGRALSQTGSSNNKVEPSKSKDLIKEFLVFFKDLQEKLNDNDFESTAELQEYLKKNLSDIDFFNDNDGLYHKEKYYGGNVNSLKLYFEKEWSSKQQKVRAKNVILHNDENELFEMETKDGLVFIDVKGNSKIRITDPDIDVTKIGGNYFEDSNYFYFLNKKENKLDTLLIYNLDVFNNGLVSLQFEDKDEDYSLYNQKYEPVNTKTYWIVREIENLLFGLRDERYYIIDANGQETLIGGVEKIYDELSNDRIMVSNGKFGFIDSKGKIAIPMKYEQAKNFEEGVTAVKYDGTYKLIDVNGKVIVDTEEDYIRIFDTDNEGKRIYSFGNGDKTYNFKGEPIIN